MKKLILAFCLTQGAISVNSQTSYQLETFSDTSLKHFRYGSAGNKTEFKWKSGVADSSHPNLRMLSFKLDPQEKAGAGKGPEVISTEMTHFGSYSASLKVPDVRKIQPNTGAVVGYFTYHTDSIEGLSEIDFEWLIADPTIIYVGTWTGHGKLQRVGRTINLATGQIYYTIQKKGHDGKSTPLALAQSQPETIKPIPDYDASKRFYTYGFDWYPDRLTWWLLHPETNEKIILWDYKGSRLGIPQNASRYRMNFWHTNNWSVEGNPKSTEAPKLPYELQVDWMLYQPFQK